MHFREAKVELINFSVSCKVYHWDKYDDSRNRKRRGSSQSFQYWPKNTCYSFAKNNFETECHNMRVHYGDDGTGGSIYTTHLSLTVDGCHELNVSFSTHNYDCMRTAGNESCYETLDGVVITKGAISWAKCVASKLDIEYSCAVAILAATIRHYEGIKSDAPNDDPYSNIVSKWNSSFVEKLTRQILEGKAEAPVIICYGKYGERLPLNPKYIYRTMPDILYSAAEKSANQDIYDDASQHLNRLLTINPAHPEGLVMQARMLKKKANDAKYTSEKISLLAKARASLDQVQQPNKLDVIICELKEAVHVETVTAQQQERTFKQCWQLVQNGQYGDAKKQLHEFMKTNPRHIEAHFLHAKVLTCQAKSSSNVEEKLTLLNEAKIVAGIVQKSDPHHPEVADLLEMVTTALTEAHHQQKVENGQRLIQQQRYEEAVDYFTELEKGTYPEDTHILILLAKSQVQFAERCDSNRQKCHLLKESLKVLEKVTEKDNSNKNAWAMMDEVDEKLQQSTATRTISSNDERPTLYQSHHLSKSDDAPPAVAPKFSGKVTTISGKRLSFGDEVGRGGYGIVYQGTWDGQQVAIKHFSVAALAGNKLTKFLSEANTMAQLRSPYLVELHDMVAQPNTYCLVMEYMPRGSLWDVLHSDYPLTAEQRHNIAQDIIQGLKVLHDKNIIHRDLKSLNVLLGNSMRAKLADFGLSEVETESSLSSNMSRAQIAGTLAWLAPEIIAEEKSHSKKTDIFSLGIIIWEIVTRQQPFAQKNAAQITMSKVQQKNEAIPDDCSPKLARLIQWCWKRDPTERPTAQQALTALAEDPTATGGARLDFS